MKPLRYFLLAAVLATPTLLVILAQESATEVQASPVTWNAAADFSATANPNAPWSYGFIPVGGSFTDFVLYDQPGYVVAGLDQWWHSVVQAAYAPTVAHNGTADPITMPPWWGDVTFPPGQLFFHPGSDGQNSVVRFTAPSDGDYQIDVTFSVGDPPPASTTTDVHVLRNGTALFDGDIDGNINPNDSEHFSATQTLIAGDIIDFTVGYGNGAFNSDTTFLDATISTGEEPTPTPPAWRLPWAEGETWYYYCGPHSTTNSCPNGPTREALDFGPAPYDADTKCQTGNEVDPASTVRSVASGRVYETPGQQYPGQYKIELGQWSGPQGSRIFAPSGNMAVYEHVVTDPARSVGDEVVAGDPLGHPSCLGDAPVVHVHVGFYKCAAPADCANRNNWTPNSFPQSGITLSGWSVLSDGTLRRGSSTDCDTQPGNGWPGSAVVCPKTAAPPLLQQTTPLAQGQTAQLSIGLTPGQILMGAWDGWNASTVDSWLTAPDGTVIDPTTSDPNVFHAKGEAFEYYQIRNPQAGNWTLHLYGADMPSEGEQVTVIVASQAAPAVGGIAELPDIASTSPGRGLAPAMRSRWSPTNYAALAAGLAAAVAALTAGAWYARRRRHRA